MKTMYGYVVWAVATLFVVYSFGLNTASAVFSDAIKASLHVSNLGVSIATGTFILGFACMQIPAGYLLDRFNARFVVSIGVFLLALGNVLISFSDTLVLYALSNFIQGMGASFAFISAAVLISQWFSASKFPIMFGLTQTFSCILAGIIHYNFTIALLSFSWNSIYRWLAVFGFILLILTLVFVKSPSSTKPNAIPSLKASLSEVLSNAQIMLCSFAAAASFGVLLAYVGFWYLKVQTFYQVENLDAVVISGMIFLGIGVGTPFWGWLSNKIKTRIKLIHFTLCIGTMLLLLGIYSPHYDINTLIGIKIISFLIGFFLSGSMLFYTMVSELSPEATRGVALSVLNTIVFLFNTLLLFIPYVFVTLKSTDFFTYLWILPFFIVMSILLLDFIKDSSPS